MLTENENKVVTALRKHSEYADGDHRVCYLDNAIPAGMSRLAFAGVLSSLTQKGLYKPIDQFFGMVLAS